MLEYVEESTLITFKEMKEVQDQLWISIRTGTIHKYLDYILYKVKKCLNESNAMNSEQNKEKRT